MTRSVAKDAWSLVISPKLESCHFEPELRWLPAQVRDNLLEAETYMGWRRIAATFSQSEAGEGDEGRSLEGMALGQLPTKRELLTWPRLCSLHVSVTLAREAFERGVERAGMRVDQDSPL